MVIAASFFIAERNFRVPDKSLKHANVAYARHTREYYLALKGKNILSHETTWMDLDNVCYVKYMVVENILSSLSTVGWGCPWKLLCSHVNAFCGQGF